MKYVSLAKSRSGWQTERPKPRKRPQPAPEKSVEPTDDHHNPDGGTSASQPEEG